MKKWKHQLKRCCSMALVSTIVAGTVSFSAPAQPESGAESWIATPYHKETGELAEGLEEAVAGKKHWLETTDPLPAQILTDETKETLTMTNGVISRTFHIPQVGNTDFYTSSYKNLYIEKELLEDDKTAEVYLGLYDKPYEEIYEGQTIKLNPDYYFVGGSEKTQENTFVYQGYKVFDECEKPFEWTPHPVYGDPAAEDWPPKGKKIEFSFTAPTTFPEAYQGIEIKLIYEMYDNLPSIKKRVEVTNKSDNIITVGKIAPEVLNGNSDMDELLLTETDFTCGDQSTIPFNVELPCGCKENNEGSAFLELLNYNHTCYEIGPAYELIKNQTFKTYNTFELIYSTYWFELRARERLGMYRKLFPWITDNPTTFHNTTALTKEVIDHAAEAGFEMIIQSFSAPDPTAQMLTRNQGVLDNYKSLVEYAHSKNVDIGIYQAQYTRSTYKGGAEYGTNGIGQWNTWCLASAAFDDYWDNFKYFVKYTGLDAVEIDGPYPGCACDNGERHINSDKETDPDPNGTDKTTGDASKYAVHNGYFDSVVKQWENAVQMMCKEFKDMGVYVNVPAWYYMCGGNKCGIGYEEIAWSQPRQEQQLYGRQIMHNASYARTMSMSWTHVPFGVYHGGGASASYTPFKDNMEDYNWILGQYLGNGLNAVFRGPALYDEETLPIMKKWVEFYRKYRGICNSDLVHVSQAQYDEEGTNRTRTVKMDTLFHVNAQNEGEKGLLWVYNQTNEPRTEILTIPMYYTGLTNMNYPTPSLKGSLGKDVHGYGIYPPNYDWLPDSESNYRFPNVTGEGVGTASFAREGVEVKDYEIDSNGNVQLVVTLPAMSFTYYAIYPQGEAPKTTVSVGEVKNLKSDGVTEQSIQLSWDKDVELTVIEDGEVIENPYINIEKYLIYRDGEMIGESMTNSFTDTGLSEESEYTYSVKAVAAGVIGEPSGDLKVNTAKDEEKPYVTHVYTETQDKIIVSFNEKIDKKAAEKKNNYRVSDKIKVQSAIQKTDNQVELTVSPLEPLKNYELTVKGILDFAKDKNEMDESSHSIVYGYISKYKMDSIDENILVDTIGNYPGKVSNVVLTDSPFGKGLVFDAQKSSYADLGSYQLKGRDTYSFNIWIKTAAEERQVILSQGQENMVQDDFSLYTENGDIIFNTGSEDGSIQVQLTGKEKLTVNQWTQITIVRDVDTFSLYINGEKTDEKTAKNMGTLDNSNMLYLGAIKNHAGGDRAQYYTGAMTNLAIYQLALNEEQIKGLNEQNLEKEQQLLQTAKDLDSRFFTEKSYQELQALTEMFEKQLQEENPDILAVKEVAVKVQEAIDKLVKKTEYKNLVSSYDFREKSGNKIINGMTGQSASMANGAYLRMNTPFGYGLFITDIRGNHVLASTNPLAVLGDYTVSGWFKSQPKSQEEIDLAGKQVLLADDAKKISVYIQNNTLYCSISDEAGETLMQASEPIKYDTINGETRQAWNHFAVTKEGNGYTLYQNGKVVAQLEKETSAMPDSILHIGAEVTEGSVSGVFNGIVNNFRFYDKALSESEIVQIQGEIGFVKTEETNIALNKTLYSDAMDDAFRLNDGHFLDMAGKDTPWTARKNGIESITYRIDLGENYQIDAISFANFFRPYGLVEGNDQAGFRRYADIVVQVSSTQDFNADITTIYNSDAENRLGQGNGTDPTQIAFELGNDIILDKPAYGRYVRMITRGFYMENGNYLNNANVAELEVFGKTLDESGAALQKLVDYAKSLDKEFYTEDSYALVEEMIEAAENVLKGEFVFEQIQTAKENLEAAIDVLEYRLVDKEELSEAIEEAEKLIEAGGYTQESTKKLKEKLKEAKDILNSETVTQEQINLALQELQKAIESLKVSKTTLEYYLNKAKEHVENGDTEDLVESIQKLFTEAIAEGEALIKDEEATKEDITKTTIKLMKAIQSLDFYVGDKADLSMALELTKKIDLTKYVEKGQAEYLAAKETAQKVMVNGDAMQPEVDAAWKALTEAMGNLKLKADKSALEDLLESLKELDMSIYTKESIQVYEAALINANAVMEDESLSEDDQITVDKAVKELTDAKHGLTRKTGEEETDESNSGESSENIDGNAPSTGDNSSIFRWIAGAGISIIVLAAAAILLMRKRRVR